MYGFVKVVTQPFVVVHVVFAAVFVWLWMGGRMNSRALRVQCAAWCTLLLLSIPVVSHLLLGALEWRYPPGRVDTAGVDAIVALGAGLLPRDQRRREPDVTDTGLERCLQAARIYHDATDCDVVVSGGLVDSTLSGPGEAELMRDVLVMLGVDQERIVAETHSRSTYENARNVAQLIAERNYQKVVLVTHAVHMPRAVACFRRQGVDVVPGPCGHRATGLRGPLYRLLAPSATALANANNALGEWMGFAWYWLHDRV